jgi:hypothetical protein
METAEEGVFCIYRQKNLVGIVKRDEESKKWLVYKTGEAVGEEIVAMIQCKNDN